VGPTASGKSAVALALAERRRATGLPTELVSCDSMQVYRGMDIGTAKPTPAERSRVPHHLLDVVEVTEEHHLGHFLAEVDRALDDIESRGCSAVLVGGTGLYVQAVVDAMVLPPSFPSLAAALEAESTEALTARLAEVDPEALARIPTGNRRRLVRALEVTIGSGRPFSSFGPGVDTYPPTPFVLTGLWPDRAVLTARISARLDAQLAAGLLEEVQHLAEVAAATAGLAPTGPAAAATTDAGVGRGMSRTARQALGYRELLAHLDGRCTLAEAMAEAKVRTRRFAVRQQRWFGRDPRITWFGPPGPGEGPGSVAAAVDALWRKRAEGRAPSVATVGHGPGRSASAPEPP
jgi:tRNA dimethylallyltransferase